MSPAIIGFVIVFIMVVVYFLNQGKSTDDAVKPDTTVTTTTTTDNKAAVVTAVATNSANSATAVATVPIKPASKYYAAPASGGFWNPVTRTPAASNPGPGDSLDACGNACYNDATCGTFTYNAGNSVCELWQLDSAAPTDVYTSYIYDKETKKWSQPVKGDWAGWDLNTPDRAANLASCQTQCVSDPACNHIMVRNPFDPASPNNCWTKGSVGIDDKVRTGIPLR